MEGEQICFVLLDLAEASVRGLLFASLFAKIETSGKMRKAILAGQYLIVRMLLWYAPAVKQLLYGQQMRMTDSRQSILSFSVYVLISLLFALFLYRREALLAGCLTVTFFALEELVRFFMYVISGVFSLLFMALPLKLFESGMLGPEAYSSLLELAALLWTFCSGAFSLLLLFLALRSYKKQLFAWNNGPDGRQLKILLVPGMMMLCISVLLRGIMYREEGMQVYSLVDANPELRLVIPLISALCAASIIRLVTLLKRLQEENEEKSSLLIYRKQTQDMQQHIRELEKLYEGIRGVRHDIKNYTADLELLLQGCGELQSPAGREMREYLDGLYRSMERLDLRYATGNAVTDVVINRKLREAEERGIAVECDFIFPKGYGIEAFDLAVILNNALENAVEACAGEPAGGRFVKLSQRCRERFVKIMVENSFSGVLPAAGEDGLPVSSKTAAGEDGLPISSKTATGEHGIGLRNIRQCALKYRGAVVCEAGEGSFVLSVLLQAPDAGSSRL